jgi:hypothetical protein
MEDIGSRVVGCGALRDRGIILLPLAFERSPLSISGMMVLFANHCCLDLDQKDLAAGRQLPGLS